MAKRRTQPSIEDEIDQAIRGVAANIEDIPAASTLEQRDNNDSITTLLQQLKDEIQGSITQNFNNFQHTHTQDNSNIMAAFGRLENRLAVVEKRSHERTIENWMSTIVEAPPHLRASQATTGVATSQPPEQLPALSPALCPISPLIPPQRHSLTPHEGEVSKFRPDITYDGKGDIDTFLFALYQSLRSYNIITPEKQVLAFGRSLRDRALNWWRLTSNTTNYHTLNQATLALETAFRDRSKPLDHVRQINKLIQTSSIHNFFLEVDRLNIQAQLPDEALWKILRGNIGQTLWTALASLRPKPNNYLEWRQAALT